MQQNWYDDVGMTIHGSRLMKLQTLTTSMLSMPALNASYEITPWLKAMVRSGVDVYTKRNEWKIRSLLIRPGIKKDSLE